MGEPQVYSYCDRRMHSWVDFLHSTHITCALAFWAERVIALVWASALSLESRLTDEDLSFVGFLFL